MIDHADSTSRQPYYRRLPGGGFVTIEITPVRNILGQRRYRGELIIERRTSVERRQGHVAPAVASAEATTPWSVLDELFPVAQSNPALASCCLALTDRRSASESPSDRGFHHGREAASRL